MAVEWLPGLTCHLYVIAQNVISTVILVEMAFWWQRYHFLKDGKDGNGSCAIC